MNNIKYSIFILLLISSSCKFVESVSLVKSISQANVININYTSFVIPFNFISNKIIIKATINNNGKSIAGSFLLDTGAPTVLSTDFAKKNAISLVPVEIGKLSSDPVKGNKEVARQYTIQNVTISMDSVSISKNKLLVRSLDFSCPDIDGIIGADILSKFAVYVDFQERSLTLFNKLNVPDSLFKGSFSFDFWTLGFQNTPVATIYIDSEEHDFIWDTGFTGDFIMQYPSSRKNKLEVIVSKKRSLIFDTYNALKSVSGRSEAKPVYFDLIDRIGNGNDTKLINPVYVLRSVNNNIGEMHSNVGIHFMVNYNYLIDWDKETIYLKQPSGFTHQNKKIVVPQDVIPSYNKDQNNAFIAGINTNSNAYKNGLRAGAIINGLDGIPISELLKDTIACNRDIFLKEKIKNSHTLEIINDAKLYNLQ